MKIFQEKLIQSDCFSDCYLKDLPGVEKLEGMEDLGPEDMVDLYLVGEWGRTIEDTEIHAVYALIGSGREPLLADVTEIVIKNDALATKCWGELASVAKDRFSTAWDDDCKGDYLYDQMKDER